MASAVAALPEITDQHAFNLKRWAEICADEALATLDFRMETDKLGHLLVIPPASYEHSHSQGSLMRHLIAHAPADGVVLPECPISTGAGVKVADVVWISLPRSESQHHQQALTTAPEICVEVLSPCNTRNEIEERRALYFAAGALEVWICGLDGRIDFFIAANPETNATSRICPAFPERIGRIDQ